MSRLDRDAVVSALRAEDVANHLGITGHWPGRWLRSRRCAVADHGTDAFGLSRDGRWHCWACDTGGDLLKLIALAEGLDLRVDFPRVLEVAAAIAGVEPDDDAFGAPAKPAPRPRPALPPMPPIADRIAIAKQRAAWLWERLYPDTRAIAMYLRERGLPQAMVDDVLRREELRQSPLRIPRPGSDARPELASAYKALAPEAMVLPVRAVADGKLVDLRARRFEPGVDQPKIIGMLGGVTAAPAENGRPRQLVGCYGHPELIDSDIVVIVEGAMDYLTALAMWPNWQVLGAVEAGSMSLVAQHAARELAARDHNSRLIIVEQFDPPRRLRDGTMVAGAADAAVNEEPNAAVKVAVRHLGPRRVGWIFCGAHRPDGSQTKDLNDMLGACIVPRISWGDETQRPGDR